MHAFFNTGITGTARDDIKLSAFFYNNNVMNTLQLLLVTDKTQACSGASIFCPALTLIKYPCSCSNAVLAVYLSVSAFTAFHQYF